MTKLTDAETWMVRGGAEHPWDSDVATYPRETDEHPWDSDVTDEHPWDENL